MILGHLAPAKGLGVFVWVSRAARVHHDHLLDDFAEFLESEPFGGITEKGLEASASEFILAVRVAQLIGDSGGVLNRLPADRLGAGKCILGEEVLGGLRWGVSAGGWRRLGGSIVAGRANWSRNVAFSNRIYRLS